MNGFVMKQANMPCSAGNLRTNLAVRRQAIGVSQNVIEGPVKLQLARSVFMIALNHVETHGPAVSDHLHVNRPKALELVDVIAVRFRKAVPRFAVLIEFQPHHFRFGTDTKMQPVVLFLEVVVQPAEIPAAIGRQKRARFLAFLPISEQRAVETTDARFPRQLHEGFRLGDADEFSCFRAIAEVVPRPVGKKIDSRTIDELEAFPRDAFPMVCGDSLPHDLSGDRNELQIKIFDSAFIDQITNFLDLVSPTRRINKSLEIGGHFAPPCKLRASGTNDVSTPLPYD